MLWVTLWHSSQVLCGWKARSLPNILRIMAQASGYCLALCASFLMVSLVRELSDISVLAMHFMPRACSLYMSPMSYMPLPPGGLVLCYQKTAPVA